MKCDLKYITLLSLLLPACTKTGVPQKENFSFYGTLTDCVTGKPLPNMHMTAIGVTQSLPAFIFGTPSVVYTVGATYTDNGGNFKITPLKISGIVDYSFLLDSPALYLSSSSNISADSIQKSGLSVYNLSYSANPGYTYLKISFSDTSQPAATDTFYLDVNCNGNNCGPGFTSSQVSSSPVSVFFPNSGTFAGNIQNGYAIYAVVGNSSTVVGYSKKSRFFRDTTNHAVSATGIGNDTAYCKINY